MKVFIKKITSSPVPMLGTLFVWSWAVPSAYFWTLTKKHSILLPHLPRAVWGLPGQLWMRIPVVYILLLFLLPLALLPLRPKAGAVRKVSKIFFTVLIAVVFIIHLLWGGAILLNLPGR